MFKIDNLITDLLVSDEPFISNLPVESRLLLIKAVTDLGAMKWLKIGPISNDKNDKIEDWDVDKIIMVEMSFYGPKETDTENQFLRVVNTGVIKCSKNNENSDNESSDEEDLRLVVEHEKFTITESLVIGMYNDLFR